MLKGFQESSSSSNNNNSAEEHHTKSVTLGRLRIFFEGGEELEKKAKEDDDEEENEKEEERKYVKEEKKKTTGNSTPQSSVKAQKTEDNPFMLKGVYNRETKMIDVTWELLPGWSVEGDTIALYIYNRVEDSSFYTKFSVSECRGATSYSLKGPDNGYCELRYFKVPPQWGTKRGSYISRSERFLVGDEVPLTADVGRDNGIITVYWSKWPVLKNPYDWIGLYKAGTRSNREYTVFKYVKEGRGTMHNGTECNYIEFERPRESGTYEFRFFFYSPYAKACGNFCSGYSNTFVINNVNELTVEVREDRKSFYVKYYCPSAEPNKGDWIGVFRSVGCTNSEYLKYKYCQDMGRNMRLNSGSVLFEDMLEKTSAKERSSWEIRFVTADGRVVARAPFTSNPKINK